METQYIPARAESFVVRVYADDFDGKWYESLPMVGGQPNAVIREWVQGHSGTWQSMWGSGNGLCDPSEDHDVFEFPSKEVEEQFIGFMEITFGQ